jgi:HEAT repeat protein
MTIKEVVTSSGDSVSWLAHREAERLSDDSLIDDLEVLVGSSKRKEVRKAAYFILGAIGKNTGSRKVAAILVSRSRSETDKYVLSSLLESLAKVEKPDAVSLEPVFDLLEEPRWLVRHAAINALTGARSGEAEERVLAHLKKTDDPFDKIYCHVTLNDIGTARSIPQISLSLTSRKPDVKGTAQDAIQAIHARQVAQ